MSVIIRLQNLPWSANASDIREFFKGLSIPEGGVHIVGGEMGDAFIAFGTDEDARLAMRKTGTSLKGIQVSLLLSSRTEMQKVIETARQQAMGLQTYVPQEIQPATQQPPAAPLHPQQPPAAPLHPQQPPAAPLHPQQPPAAPLHSQQPPAAPLHSQQPPAAPLHSQPPPAAQLHSQPPPAAQLRSQHPPSVQEELPFQNNAAPNILRQDWPGSHPQNLQQPYPYGTQQQPSLNNQQPHPAEAKAWPNANERIPHSVSPARSGSQFHPNLSGPITSQQPQNQQNGQFAPSHGHGLPDNYNENSVPGHAQPQDTAAPKTTSPTPQPIVDRKDRKSGSSTSDRDRRESKNRDDRRRRSRSRDRDHDRDRDRDRDRRRRHRTRSRSRSRDRSYRRRRSRSRDRTRDRGDRRERDHSRRDRPEKENQAVPNKPETRPAEVPGGIPGLGEIPDDIPKEGLSICAPVSDEPIQTKDPPVTSRSRWTDNLDHRADPRHSNPYAPPPHASYPNMGPSHTVNSIPGQAYPQQTRVRPDNPTMPSVGSVRPALPHTGGQMQPADFSRPDQPSRNFHSGNAPFSTYGPQSSSGHPPVAGGGPLNTPLGRLGPIPNERPLSAQKEPLLPLPVERTQRDLESDPRRCGTDYDPRNQRSREPGFRGENLGDPTNQWAGSNESWGRMHPQPRGEGNGYDKGAEFPAERSDRRNMPPVTGAPDRRNEFSGDFDDRDEFGFGDRERFDRRGAPPGRGRDMEVVHQTEPMNDEHFVPRDRQPNDFDATGSDRVRGGPGFVRGRGDRVPPVDESLRGRRVKTRCVEVLHIPPNASYKSIKDLFSGIYMSKDCIKLIADSEGNRIGVALIEFASTRDAFEAYKRTGSYLFNSRVTINFIDEGFYHESVDMNAHRKSRDVPPLMDATPPAPLIQSSCLYVRGLPVGGTEHDVARIFEGFQVDTIVLEFENGSRHPTGGCFVRLMNRDDASFALNKLQNANIDGTPVTVMPCTEEIVAAAIQNREKIYSTGRMASSNRQSQHPQPTESANNSNKSRDESTSISSKAPVTASDLLTDSVVIKSITSDVNETSIRDFLSDEGLIPESVYFSRPNGEGRCDAFVVFPKISEAKRALAKHSQKLGSHCVTVELISKPMLMAELGKPFNPLELYKKSQAEEGTTNDRGSYSNNTESSVHSRLRNSPTSHPASQNRKLENGPSRTLPSRLTFPNGRVSETAEPPRDFGAPGCVVALTNIPYSATTDDILAFFREFRGLGPDNIIRRYDERNRPTADARVALRSNEDAALAVNKLNLKFIRSRPITVSLV